MSMTDDLAKLSDLHARGVLSADEFERAKARVIGETTRSAPDTAASAINTLRLSRDDRWIGGVCGGLARTTGMASWVWRLFFTAFVLCAGCGVLVYLLLWIFVPREDAYPHTPYPGLPA